MTTHTPSAAQLRLADLPVSNVLVVAPAGCGKTEALAHRARAVLERGELAVPRKVLALTYSNKAKANFASRVRSGMSPSHQRRVTVTNFHGLSARIIRAHGSLMGLSRDLIFPESSWRARQLRDLNIDWRNGGAFEAVLTAAKAGSADDDDVLERIERSGHPEALAFEQALRQEGRLDYDDLLRHATRILAVSDVAALYRAHFGMTMVDEVQDLSLRHYGIVRAVGGDAVTYAGDPAQGIFAFAGAQPDEVFAAISDLNPHVVELNQSYRSSPAVLRAANILAEELGATRLECGAPDLYPDGGHVHELVSSDTAAEACALLGHLHQVVTTSDSSVGVIVRRGSRAAQFRDAASAAGVAYQDWGAPTHVPRIAALLRHHAPQAARAYAGPVAALTELQGLCRAAIEASDATTLDELASACQDLREMLEQGMDLATAVATCREAADPEAPVEPGLHVLTGHSGKGQEFDWVVVMGLESGHIPDFRNEQEPGLTEELRLLHVMVSRARYGVILTYARATMTWSGWRATHPSPWLPLLQPAVSS